MRLDLLGQTARKARPRPSTPPQDRPRGWTAVMRAPATPQPGGGHRAPPAPRRLGGRPASPAVASVPRAYRSGPSRLVSTARAAMILVLPLLFAAAAYLLQGYYASLRASAASPLDGWMNQILLTLLGGGFVVLCYVFLIVLPRMLKNR